MGHIPRAFYDAAVALHRPIAMEGEAGLTSTWDLNYITLGWAEGWVADENGVVHDIPDVNKAKWLTRGKAMTNWCDRWSGNPAEPGKKKTPELQVAYFNGLGYETWENGELAFVSRGTSGAYVYALRVADSGLVCTSM